jgi:hypothetical protein
MKQAPKACDFIMNSSQSQQMPSQSMIAGCHRLAQCRFRLPNNARRTQTGAGNKNAIHKIILANCKRCV